MGTRSLVAVMTLQLKFGKKYKICLLILISSFQLQPQTQNLYDFAIIGGGIVGLSAAMALSRTYNDRRILVLEKESNWAPHQTGHNSGVIHSGIYYKPGSLKAKFSRDGNTSLVQFCQQHGIDYEICGKIIVATEAQEIPLLENLYQRGLENGLKVEKISNEQVKEIEPHVSCLARYSRSQHGNYQLQAGLPKIC